MQLVKVLWQNGDTTWERLSSFLRVAKGDNIEHVLALAEEQDEHGNCIESEERRLKKEQLRQKYIEGLPLGRARRRAQTTKTLINADNMHLGTCSVCGLEQTTGEYYRGTGCDKFFCIGDIPETGCCAVHGGPVVLPNRDVQLQGIPRAAPVRLINLLATESSSYVFFLY